MATFNDIKKANESIETIDLKGKEYAMVNQRIKAFRMVYPEGTIETEMLSNENGVAVFKATVKNIEIVLGTGHAYEKEGSSFINKTSYIENAESSAIGRALGMCGFGIDTSVASYEEVANAMANQETPTKDATKPDKASSDAVKYISSNATKDEIEAILKAYKAKELKDLTGTQATRAIMAINKRKAEKGNAV